MRLKYHFEKAQRILAQLTPEDRTGLEKICRKIRRSQDALLSAASEKMHRCTQVCAGLCCRNVQLDAVIGLWDFVYILALENSVKETIVACLENETPFFSSDCIFLADGVGPCIFSSNVRPEICITAFCTDDGPVKREIDDVKRKYLKMIWYVRLSRPRAWGRWLAKTLNEGKRKEKSGK